MNAPLRDNQVGQRTGIVDCDIHPAQRSAKDLYPFLSKHWIDHLESFGMNVRQALSGQHMFPRTMAAGMRVDAYPGDGSPPGSDLALMSTRTASSSACWSRSGAPAWKSAIRISPPHFRAR